MKLTRAAQISLIPTAPFDFDSTFHKPDHFTSGDNVWKPGTRWQTWYWGGKQLGLKFENRGTRNSPRVRVGVYARSALDSAFLSSLTREIRYRFNLDLDLLPFYRTFRKDRVLGPILKRWRGMRPGHPSSLYEYLIIGIILQNATVRRSIQMFRTLLENYGRLLEFDRKRLWGFWKSGGLSHVSEAELRALKLGYRARSIKRIDDQFAHGLVDELALRGQRREVQQAALLDLYGVGPATVWYLLFDVFHHWDFFDHISPWEQRIYSKLFFQRNPEHPVPARKILKHFEQYRPYQQLAVHYAWEDLWWKRKHKKIPWLESLIRV